MHGYYIDERLYNKAKMLVNPNEFEESIQKKVKQTISEQNIRKTLTKEVGFTYFFSIFLLFSALMVTSQKF